MRNDLKKETAFNIPNLISIFRILLIGAYLYFFYGSMDHARLISGIIVLIAGFSDWLDGWIARTFDMKTKVGAALDPLADKLMSLTVLLTLVQVRIIPLWFFLGLLLKEALLIAGGLWLYFRGIHESIPSNRYGKLATIFFYIAIVLLILDVAPAILHLAFAIVLLLNWIALLTYIKRAYPYIQNRNQSL